jgi:coenzyme F420-dependent glucose-6-phosphate dehydrogenase
MVEIGYKLTSEQQPAPNLIKYAKQAEDAGFDFAMISDHYHPWVENQGQSPYVWSTLGAISQVTEKIKIGTAVTCPTVRQHPAIVAQAAATVASLMPGRFILGLGSGENLNEHIYGDSWPAAPIRIEMLEEAVDLIRKLWQGGMQDYEGFYYHVENARIYSLPEELPPIYMAAAGPIAAETAGISGDGFITGGAGKKLLKKFKESGGEGKPSQSEVMVCWAKSKEEAIKTAYKYWPIVAIKGELSWEIKTPTHFQQLAKMIKEEDMAKNTVCSPDPQDHINKIKKSVDAGFDQICIQQIGLKQSEFIEFCKKEILPEFKD